MRPLLSPCRQKHCIQPHTSEPRLHSACTRCPSPVLLPGMSGILCIPSLTFFTPGALGSSHSQRNAPVQFSLDTHTSHLSPLFHFVLFSHLDFQVPPYQGLQMPQISLFFISVPAACYAEQAGPLFPLQPNQSFSAQKSVLDIADNQTQQPEVACHRQIMQRQVFPYSFTLLL